ELEWTSHIEQSLKLLNAGAPPDFAMAILLHHNSLDEVQRIVERLKFSRSEMHHVMALVENLPRFSEVRQMSMSALKRFFRLERFEDHLELARIHLAATGGDLSDWKYAQAKRHQWRNEDI